MATNALLTIDEITYEALIVLKNQLIMGKCVLRQFDDNFGIGGAKIGDTLRVRVPPRFQSTNGPAPALQGVNESYKVLQANNQYNIAVNFSSKDLALAMDNFSDNLLRPSMAQLASDVDGQGTLAASVGYSVNNSGYFTANYAGSYAGFFNLATPGGYPSGNGCIPWTGITLNSTEVGQANAGQVFLQARARLLEQASPTQDMFVVLSPAAMGATVAQMFVNFNPQSDVSELYRTGLMGTYAGARFYESQNAPIFTSGTWTNNANVSVAAANGDAQLNIGRTGSSAAIAAGDQFVVAGVYSVNPLNRQSTGILQTFVVTQAATANAAGNVLVQIYPSCNSAGQYQTISALPAALSNVYWQGTSNTSTTTNFFFNRNALALAIAPLSEDLPGAEVSTARDTDIMLRYVKQYVATTDLRVERFDILFGWAVVRPELGCILRG